MKALSLPNFEELLESIQDGFVVVDKTLRYVYLNKKAEEIIGIPIEKLLGKRFTDKFPDHNLNLVDLLKIVEQTWIERKNATLEIYFKPQKRWYYLIIYPFKDMYSVIFRDITAEKQIRDDLQSSKKQLDLLFRNISDGVVIQDPTGKFVYVNNAAVEMSKFPNEKSMLSLTDVGLPGHYFLLDEEGIALSWEDAPGRQVLFGGKESAEKVLCVVDKETREEIWLDVKSAKIFVSPDKVPHVMSIFHNVTVLKKLERQKDNFLSLVSHELKTPLTSMKAYLDILQKQSKHIHDAKTATIISRVKSDTDKLIELVHSLLDISRIQEGKLQIVKHKFSLASLLKEVTEDIQPITHHPIQVNYSKTSSVNADRDKVAQVLVNLLTNAIKYSPEEKPIILQAKANEHEVVISVKDFGTGISQKEQKKIFNRFYQSARYATFPGLGLGLYISSEIVRMHNGKIWVKSTEGKGSTFYFSLPYHKSK